MAALIAVELYSESTSELLELLQGYVIFTPATAVLRGVVPKHSLEFLLDCPAATFRPPHRICFANVIRMSVADEIAAVRSD